MGRHASYSSPGPSGRPKRTYWCICVNWSAASSISSGLPTGRACRADPWIGLRPGQAPALHGGPEAYSRKRIGSSRMLCVQCVTAPKIPYRTHPSPLSFFRNRLIQVQNGARHRRPGGEVACIPLRIVRWLTYLEQLRRSVLVVTVVSQLLLRELPQNLHLAPLRVARRRQAESVADAFVGIAPRLGQSALRKGACRLNVSGIVHQFQSLE